MSNQDKITALYSRLSKDDLNVGDSDSIVHQRAILEKYAEDNCFPNVRVFIDDGYSGVSFERPGFQEMYKLIEAGKVGIVITKDLSRLGRNYIEVGNFTEFVFPRYGVRYIAINDNYDSLFSDNNELAPFKNLFNEWYARDTSKKIRSVFKAKAERGERLNDRIPYGYRPDPASGKKYSLLVNEETAPVVKLIYNLCAEGNGPNAIAAILKEKEIYKPSMYRYLHDGFLGKTDINDPYGWNGKTVGNILDNEVYLGHTVMWKSSVVTKQITLTINYDRESLVVLKRGKTVQDTVYGVKKTGKPYEGKVGNDFYGRPSPRHAHGTGNIEKYTNSTKKIMQTMMELFTRIIDPDLLIRRVNVCACNLIRERDIPTDGPEQLSLFFDYETVKKQREAEKKDEEKERNIQRAMLDLQGRYGKNVVLKGMNLMEGATTKERNGQVGGHKAE